MVQKTNIAWKKSSKILPQAKQTEYAILAKYQKEAMKLYKVLLNEINFGCVVHNIIWMCLIKLTIQLNLQDVVQCFFSRYERKS